MLKTNTLKQHSKIAKKVLAALFSVLLAIMLATPAIVLSTNKAWASPTADSVRAQIEAQSSVLDQASAQYGEALAKQQEAQAVVDEAQSKIDDANSKIDDLGHKLGVRARSMYRQGTSTFLDMFLGASSFREIVNNIEILNAMNASDASMVAESKALREEVEQQKAVYDESLAIAQEQANEAYRIKSNAESIQADLQSQLESLTAAERQQAVTPSGGGGSTPTPPAPGPGAGDAVSRAYAEIGKPYIWGAAGPEGYDCSGLVSYCLTGVHAHQWTTWSFMGWPRVSDPVPGDVCTNEEHCGLYIGGGSMIHAPTFGQTVCCAGVQGGMIFVRR